MEQKNILDLFTVHPVAMNILMVVVLLVGGYVLTKINVQFFPDYSYDYVRVTTISPGASAEDVEQSITDRMELELKNINNLKTLTSTSIYGTSNILLEMNPGTDISTTVNDVEGAIATIIPDLPSEAERPVVQEVLRFEQIANLIVTGNSFDQLRSLANEFKDELISRGIGKITLSGLPVEEIAIQIPGETLQDLGLTLPKIAQTIRSYSNDTSVGISGLDDSARELRLLDQRRSEIAFEDIPVLVDLKGGHITLGDIAIIERRAKPSQIKMSYQGQPAVQLALQRPLGGDTLESAAILHAWIAEVEHNLPPGIGLLVTVDQSIALRDRIRVLINNGLAGLILVLIMLYVFLNKRLAFWVAMGIPVALLGAVTILYLIGGSINMVTLFGFIMVLGIIVDDAIVVGEEALTRFLKTRSPVEAASGAAKTMFVPIIAASFTTIFAFLPVILVTGVIGILLGNIAIVVMCVVAMSLIEAFIILPGHLRHAFEKGKTQEIHDSVVDRLFEKFKYGFFAKILALAVSHPISTVAIGIGLFILTIGLFASGRLSYSFFPSPELNNIYVNVTFSAGTPATAIDEYLIEVEEKLYETEAEFGVDLITSAIILHNSNFSVSGGMQHGRNRGAVFVELVQSDTRDVRTPEFLRSWSSKLHQVPGLENVVGESPEVGPPGKDIQVQFTADSKIAAKQAANDLVGYLKSLPGVYGVVDDTPYGNQQEILRLNQLGQSLGLSVEEISRQLRSSLEGVTVQSFTTNYHDIEVNVTLPDKEKNLQSEWSNFHLVLPSGGSIQLLDVVEIEPYRGFEILRHFNGEFTIKVSASVDESVALTSEILAHLNENIRPRFIEEYGVNWDLGSRQKDQEETENSMKTGALIALALIYLTLAWIFGSYTWPFFVMLAIPFGIVGAIWGHFIMNIPITIITFLGLIGLSGIVVNNAIVLVVFYKKIRETGTEVKEAMIEAGCQRLRPVMLSSLTTIVGLLPLLFEKSTQAQFLIPMVVTLVFGLAFSSALVLLFVPATLSMYERVAIRFKGYRAGKKLITQSD